MQRGLILILLLSILSPLRAGATGPRSVTSGGKAVKWSSVPIQIDLESGLSVRGKDVSALVSNALGMWTGVTEAKVSFTQASLAAEVDDTNICCFFYDSSACPSGPADDGKNPLVIDADGAITAAFFGTANQFTTLGFASIISFDATSGAAVKGEAVFNAACLNSVEVDGCKSKGLSFSDDDFTSFIVHEIGHFLGLDHSQVNLTEATDGDSSNDQFITTMFPTFIVGNGANFKVPKRDDKVGLAQLYPASDFDATTWKITGTVFKSDGSNGLQCANLIARNQEDATKMKTDAISALSGDFSPSGTADGTYTIPGLTAGATYKVEVQSISKKLTGASGFTPCRGGTTSESSPPQFTAQAPITNYSRAAGETQSGVNFTSDLAALMVSDGGLANEGGFPSARYLPPNSEIDDAIAAIELKSTSSSSCSSSSSTTGTTASSSSSGGCALIPH